MFKRAKRLDSIRGFGIDRVARHADALSRANPRWPVLRLENLDTNLPLPPEALEATRAALGTAEANSWLPFTGDLSLRAAISDLLLSRTGHRYDPETQIVVTSGGTEATLDVLLATIDPGDEVVLTDPTYAGLVNRVRLAGAMPRFAAFRAREGEWRLDLDHLRSVLTKKTAALLLMSPSMPSGGVLSGEDWQTVCDLCVERDLPLLYDSAMERLLFDGRPLVHPVHFGGMAERTVIAGSLSKEHRMIGWRVGWIAGPAAVVEDAGWVHVYNTTTPVGIARAAATAVLRGEQSHVEECVRELQRRRDVVLEALSGWPLIRPGGGWSMLLDVASLGLEPLEASKLLIEESAVAATPMLGWGGDVAQRHVRFVFATESAGSLASLRERVEGTRLAEAARAATAPGAPF